MAVSAAGRCNLKVIRDCDGTVVFETNTSRRTVAFYNPERGRNYRWTVARELKYTLREHVLA